MKYKVYKFKDELELVSAVNADLDKCNKPMTINDSHEIVSVVYDGKNFVAFVKCLV